MITLEAVETVSEVDLSELLQTAGYPGSEVVRFERQEINNRYGTGVIHRFQLHYKFEAGRSLLRQPPDSLILKESKLIESQAEDDALGIREIECYRRNLFDGIGSHLVIPRSYGTFVDAKKRKYWLCIEDYKDALDVPWNADLLKKAISDIGELHAVWWEKREAFNKMSFLRVHAQAMYANLWRQRIAENCLRVNAHPASRRIEEVFTSSRCTLLMKLPDLCNNIYSILEILPQTLLHHDIWLPNLGIYGDRTVLIDWSYIGPGTPGADLSFLYLTLLQQQEIIIDEMSLLYALHESLNEYWQLPLTFEALLKGFEISFCLRPAHILGGPILGGILSGRRSMLGSNSLDDCLDTAEAVFALIERGLAYLDHF